MTESDRAYENGKRAFRKDYGSHGPTLHQSPIQRTPNPHDGSIELAEAWDRGYAQDVRRG